MGHSCFLISEMKRSRTQFSGLGELDSVLVTSETEGDMPCLSVKQRKCHFPWVFNEAAPIRIPVKVSPEVGKRKVFLGARKPNMPAVLKTQESKNRSRPAVSDIMRHSFDNYPPLYSKVSERRDEDGVIALTKPLFNFGKQEEEVESSSGSSRSSFSSSFESDFGAYTSVEDISDVDKSVHSLSEYSKASSPDTSGGEESDGGGAVFF